MTKISEREIKSLGRPVPTHSGGYSLRSGRCTNRVTKERLGLSGVLDSQQSFSSPVRKRPATPKCPGAPIMVCVISTPSANFTSMLSSVHPTKKYTHLNFKPSPLDMTCLMSLDFEAGMISTPTSQDSPLSNGENALMSPGCLEISLLNIPKGFTISDGLPLTPTGRSWPSLVDGATLQSTPFCGCPMSLLLPNVPGVSSQSFTEGVSELPISLKSVKLDLATVAF